jgi:hypothetical protein
LQEKLPGINDVILKISRVTAYFTPGDVKEISVYGKIKIEMSSG